MEVHYLPPVQPTEDPSVAISKAQAAMLDVLSEHNRKFGLPAAELSKVTLDDVNFYDLWASELRRVIKNSKRRQFGLPAPLKCGVSELRHQFALDTKSIAKCNSAALDLMYQCAVEHSGIQRAERLLTAPLEIKLTESNRRDVMQRLTASIEKLAPAVSSNVALIEAIQDLMVRHADIESATAKIRFPAAFAAILTSFILESLNSQPGGLTPASVYDKFKASLPEIRSDSVPQLVRRITIAV